MTEKQRKPETQDVAVLQPPRLPWHPAIGERFNISKSEWLTLVNAVFPSAQTTQAVCLALAYCQARKLDVFKKMVHIVPIYDAKKRAMVETVWPSIAEHRATAFRTGQYAGCDPTVWGEDKKGRFTGRVKEKKGQEERWVDKTVELTYPDWAQVTVYRIIGGQRCAFPGPRCYFLAGYGRQGGTDLPNDRWAQAPHYMLEKQAEAAALRKAFPEEIGDWLSGDEAERYAGPTIDLGAEEVEIPAAPEPSDFTDEGEPGTTDATPEEPADGLTPAERKANEIILLFRAAKDINALNQAYASNQSHIDALEMPLREAVEAAFDEAGRAIAGS